MAEYAPPTDNVPIFDVTNFAPSGSGLTETQIASKFLRFPTGQGTETLSTLITGTIKAPSSGSTNINTTGGGGTNIGMSNIGTISIKGKNLNIFDDIVTGAPPYPAINIGKYNNDATRRTTTTINGDVNIGFIGGGDTTINQLFTDNLNAISDTSLLDIGINIITGNPGDNLAIRIGENLSSGIIEIGKNQTSGSTLIGAGDATTNTRNITLGNTTGAFDTNTTLAGKTTINKLTLASSYTPSYDYPVALTGSVGALITGVNISPLTYTGTPLAKTMSTLSLTKGLWIVTGYVVTGAFIANGYSIYNINTVQNTTAGGTTLSSNDQSVLNTHTSKNTLTFVYSTNVSIDIYFNYQSSYIANLTSLSFRANRMA